jgi:ubiquitin-hydrolase Zn-finger-containing protein
VRALRAEHVLVPATLALVEGSRTMTVCCSHLDSIQFTELPESIDGCEECLASGGWWVHLRMCHSCAHIGCCDDSPSKHASAHARSIGHPVIRSAEPGEDWSYCYIDDITFVLNR